MSRSKDKGTAWETAIVAHLRAHGVPHAERRALAGTLDRGDIAGIPGVVIEAKSAARLDLAGWLAEAEQERANDNATHGIVWAKRTGKTSPADGYVVMSGATLVQLLTEAGYIPRPGLSFAHDLVAVDETHLLAELRNLIQRHDPPPSCTCPLIDVTNQLEKPGSVTVKGYSSSCPVCPNPYAKAEQTQDGAR